MAALREATIIEDDDDVGNPPLSQRARSASVVSSASSHTLRAESPEQVEVPNFERLSVQRSREPQTYRNGVFHSSDNERKRPSPKPDVQVASRQRSRMSSNNGLGRIVIDIEDDEALNYFQKKEEKDVINPDKIEEAELKLEAAALQELNSIRNRQYLQVRGLVRIRNAPISLPLVEISSYDWNGHFLRFRKVVELADGSFLMIKTLTKSLETGEVKLRGWQLKRTRELGGLLQKKTNELCFVYDMDLDDVRPYAEQAVLEVEVGQVRQIRKVVCTNSAFPSYRFDKSQLPLFTEENDLLRHIETKEVLVARWKLTTKFVNSSKRLEYFGNPNKYDLQQVEHLSGDECSPACSIPASRRRTLWRSKTVLGGSATAKVINGVSTEQAYTYVDTFSGGGGTLAGARLAGLKLLLGVDCDLVACATLQNNFPDMDVFQMTVNDFIALEDPLREFIADVLHISPPCPPYSPMKRCAGKNDDWNTASLFIVENLLRKVRPRFATLEQTFGITWYSEFNKTYFPALIRMFTDSGYCVMWKVVKFENYGLAQRRRRLMIVAAGPGETLPEFPPETHSDYRSKVLKPYTSVRQVLNSIPRNAAQNNPAQTPQCANHDSWPDSGLAPTLTTGAEFGHPSGNRGLTYREFATLNGFPHSHRFCGNGQTAIYRQIGNAVPPLIAEIFFGHIVKHLKKMDTEEKRRLFQQ